MATKFDKLTNNELDSLYYETVGYHPIKNDGISRAECIKLLIEHEVASGKMINPQKKHKAKIVNLPAFRIVKHPFYPNNALLFIYDTDMIFVSQNESGDWSTWYTGIKEREDLSEFLNECATGEHDCSGSGFIHNNLFDILKEIIE